MNRTTAVKALLFLFVCGLTIGCAGSSVISPAIEEPTASVHGVSLRGFTLDSVTLLLEVEVSNPNPVSLPLTGFTYRMYRGEDSLASGKVELRRHVEAGDTTLVKVPAELEFDHLLSVVTDLRPGDVFPYRVEVSLRVEPPLMAPLEVPLTLRGELPIPATPEVTIESFRWEMLTLRQARGEFVLNLHNPNPFSIRVQQMTYQLRLDGDEVAYSRLRESVEVKMTETRELRLSIRFSPTRFGSGLFRSLRGEGTGYKVSGQMTMKTPYGSLRIPYDEEGWIGFKGD